MQKHSAAGEGTPQQTHHENQEGGYLVDVCVCRGAGLVVVGLCEHRSEQWKNPAYAGSMAPWNVATDAFSGESEARKQGPTPPPPHSPQGLDARGGEKFLPKLPSRQRKR